jgi:hypothetical protein
MSLINLIVEGRKETFVQKYSGKFNQEQLDGIINKSEALAGQNKYLEFMGKVINPRNFNDDLNIIFKLLTKFSSIGQNLDVKDINQYKSMGDLKKAITDYDNKIRREVKTVDDADVVFEDDKMIVVTPKTYKASCQFGAGTKWCTTSSPSYFDRYNEDAKLFYFIDKTKPTSDPTYKVALLQKYDGDRTYFNAVDDNFKTGWIFGTEKLENILSRVMSYLSTTYADQIKIWSDKVAAEKERERLNREREQNRIAARRRQQEERRENNEFNLEDCDDCELVYKVNALFNYLVINGDLQVIDEEDKEKIEELKTQIEELNVLYDNTDDEDRQSELETTISELEQELEDLISDKEDIYNIIPGDYSHYGLQMFDYEGQEYAVGTESESEEAAKNAVENLLDDIGIEGFNSGFVENHINEDEVEDYIRQFFDYDIRENPEAYLDDEDKEMSRSQEREIEELMQEWRYLEEKTKQTDDEDELQEIYDRVDEIRDEIDEIKENPDGDYSEDKIESTIDDRVYEYSRDPESFVRNYIGEEYLTWAINNNFIDKYELIDAVVDSDGYGVSLNTYDHSYDTEDINGTTYYIFRIT